MRFIGAAGTPGRRQRHLLAEPVRVCETHTHTLTHPAQTETVKVNATLHY